MGNPLVLLLANMFQKKAYYETSESFYEPFREFKDKIDSLQRLVILVSGNLSGYLSGKGEQVTLYDDDPSLAFIDIDPKDIDGMWLEIMEEERKTDKERFHKYFYWSIITALISLLEKLLEDLVKDISKGKFEQPENGYVKRYIDILNKEYGLPIKITREENNRLYKIRKIRNDYIHSLWSDFASIVFDGLGKISEKESQTPYNLELLDFSFKTISDIVSKIEAWCIV